MARQVDTSARKAEGPTRTCVGCRRRAAKRELLRVVVDGEGPGLAVVPDPRGRAPGRGAHLHPTVECLELALRRRAFPRALRVTGRLASGPVEEYVRQLGSAGGLRAHGAQQEA